MPEHRPRWPGLRPVGWAVAALVALPACAGVPTGGEVTRVREVVEPAGNEDRFPDSPVRPVVQGPKAGAGPEDVVRGFLDAHADPTNDHDVARLFLVSSAAWTDRVVTVHAGERSVETERTVDPDVARVVVTVQRRGLVSVRGDFEARPGNLTLRFQLTRVDGEWRVAAVPPGFGLLLSDGKFRSAYRRVTLYFPDPERRHLVPDPIFLPQERLVLGTVSALLQGPTGWVGKAARTAVPPNTRAVATPTVVDEIAQVNLSRELESTPAEARAALAAQFAWTLTEPGLGVSGVRLLVEGQPFRVPEIAARQPHDRTVWRGFSPEPLAEDDRLFFVRDRHLYALGGTALTPDVVRPDEAGVVAGALSARGRVLAAIVEAPDDRRTLMIGPVDGDLRSGVTADELSSLSWADDEVWAVQSNGGGQSIVSVPVAAQVSSVVRADLGGARITALRLSPEGARAAVVTDGVLRVGRVERDAEGTRVAVLRPIAQPLVDVTAVAWSGATRLVVVARLGTRAQPGLYEVDVDGFTLSEEPTDGLPGRPDRLAARAVQPLVAQVAGVLYKRAGAAGWSRIDEGSEPAYAG